SGVFVADESRLPVRISLEGISSLEDVLHVMELRIAIEVQAAALAAERATAKQVSAIEEAISDIQFAISKGEHAVNEDFAFHSAVAAASGNPKFIKMLEFLGRHIIPRQSIRTSIGTPKQQQQYLRRIQGEHRR